MIPKSICSQVEKLQRKFIWGETDGQRKTHLIKWDTCCLSRKEGGLGFKKPYLMNEAFIMKLTWELLEKPSDLVNQVLYGKYGRGKSLLDDIGSCQSDSSLWKAIVKIWPKIKDNMVSMIKNGQDTLFWTDRWVYLTKPLMLYDNISVEEVNLELKVADMVNSSRTWDIHTLNRIVPRDVLSYILAMAPPLEEEGKDSIG